MGRGKEMFLSLPPANAGAVPQVVAGPLPPPGSVTLVKPRVSRVRLKVGRLVAAAAGGTAAARGGVFVSPSLGRAACIGGRQIPLVPPLFSGLLSRNLGSTNDRSTRQDAGLRTLQLPGRFLQFALLLLLPPAAPRLAGLWPTLQ